MSFVVIVKFKSPHILWAVEDNEDEFREIGWKNSIIIRVITIAVNATVFVHDEDMKDELRN